MLTNLRRFTALSVLLTLAHSVYAVPVAPSPATAPLSSADSPPSGTAPPPASATVPPASDDPNGILWNVNSTDVTPEPQRGALGTSLLGPENVPMALQNPDLLAPPSTDSGTV